MYRVICIAIYIDNEEDIYDDGEGARADSPTAQGQTGCRTQARRHGSGLIRHLLEQHFKGKKAA